MMTRRFGWPMHLAVVALSTLTNCKSLDSELTSSPKDGSNAQSTPNTSSDGIHFNLATYTRTTPALAAIGQFAAPGDAYLAIGNSDRFQIKTNMTTDAVVQPDAAPTFDCDLWVDGTVFGHKIAGDGKGQVIQVTGQARPAPAGLQAIVRYLGQEKYHGTIAGSWDQRFTRSLLDAALIYPLPMLGIQLKGNIGGEFGGKSQVGYQDTKAIATSFIPHLGLSAGIGGGVKALSFASATAMGQVNLIDTNITSVASLGYHKDLGLAVGNLGIEDGDFKTLNGRIVAQADADLSLGALLPPGVSPALWQAAASAATGINPKHTWEHTVWAPTPVPPQKLPTYGNYLKKFINPPASAEECRSRYAKFEPQVRRYNSNIDASVRALAAKQDAGDKDPTLTDQMRAQATLKTNFNMILADVQAACADL